MLKKNYKYLINNQSSSFYSDFKNLIHNKFLIYSFFRKEVLASYTQSFFGIAYFFLFPLFQALVFDIFIKNVSGNTDSSPVNFVFYLLSITYWNFFSNSLLKGANSFFTNARLVRRIHLNKLALFSSSILTSYFNLFITTFTFLVVISYFLISNQVIGIDFSYRLLFIPILLIYTSLFTTAMALIIASFTLRYRDGLYGLPFILQMLMFVSPVLYSTVNLSKISYIIMSLNPVTFIIETFRWCFYSENTFDPILMCINIILFLCASLIAVFIYNKYTRLAADII